MHICAHSRTHACNYHVVNPVIILAEHKYTRAWTYTHVHTHTDTLTPTFTDTCTHVQLSCHTSCNYIKLIWTHILHTSCTCIHTHTHTQTSWPLASIMQQFCYRCVTTIKSWNITQWKCEISFSIDLIWILIFNPPFTAGKCRHKEQCRG